MITLQQGDCLELMKALEDNSIDLTVTSPPYDNLRTYNGNISQWNEQKWKNIIQELFRVTKKGGVVVWVVGDATIKGSETGTSFRQALWAMDCGFNLHDTMIYQKINYVPLTHNRYEQSWEYIFIFSNGKPKTFQPILIPCKHPGKIEKYGLNRRESHGKEHSMRLYKETTLKETKNTKISPNIFSYSIGKEKTRHPAPFPEKLAKDHILTWSNENDIILDPFMGSGTTGKMAIKNNRNFIGFELDQEYFKIAETRIDNAKSKQESFIL
jgi:DNA modification methylase